MTDKRTLADLIQLANVDSWLATEKEILPRADLRPYLTPSRKTIGKHSDEDLAELIATKGNTREGQIAASILRQREAWRTPARWSVIISVASLMLAAAAFARTL